MENIDQEKNNEKISVKEIEYCKMSVTYKADKEEISNKLSEIVKAFRKAPVPGFRKNKATDQAIKFHYKKQINDSLKRALAEEAYHNTIFEKEWRPIGPPIFMSMLLQDGEFTCSFNLNIRPNFTLESYRDFDVVLPDIKMTALEVSQQIMQNLRIKYGETIPYDENDISKERDNLILNYKAYINDELIETLCSDGEMLTLGVSKIEGFDANLVGMKVGEIREFYVTLPEESLPSFAGKTVKFQAELVTGSKLIPCPLDDELAKRMGKQNLNELKDLVDKIAMSKVEEAKRNAILDKIRTYLLNHNNLEVPVWLALSEAKYLAAGAKLEWDALPEVDKDGFVKMATSNVKLSLILDKIREVEPETELSEQEIFNIVKNNLIANQEVRKQNGLDPLDIDQVIHDMNANGQLQVLFARIKDEYVLDFINKTIKFLE